MAFASQGALLQESHKTSSSTWTTTGTLARALAVGEFSVVVIATDNLFGVDGSDNEHVTLTDSVGNLYYKAAEYRNDGTGTAATGVTTSLWWTVASVELPTSGTYTLTVLSALTAKALTSHAWTIGSTTVRIEDTARSKADAADCPSATLSSLVNTEHLFVRAVGRESASTAFTPTTNYTALTAVASSGSTDDTNASASGEWRILTATTDSSDPTTNNVDHATIYVAFTEVAAGSIYPRRLAQYVSGTDATSYTVTATTPAARDLVLAWVATLDSQSGGTITAPTVSGQGLTWTLIRTATEVVAVTSGADDHVAFWLYSAQGDAPSAGDVTVDFGAVTVQCCFCQITQYINGNYVVQTATNTDQTAPITPLTVTLAAFAGTNHAVAAGFVTVGDTLGYEGAGYTRVAHGWLQDAANETYDFNCVTNCWRPEADTTADIIDVIGMAAGVIGIAAEIGFGAPPMPPLLRTGPRMPHALLAR